MKREDVLDLQTSIAEYLQQTQRHAPATRSLGDEVDLDRLDLVADLTRSKRIAKVRRLMPATFAALEASYDSPELSLLLREFATQYTPDSSLSLRHAQQFLDYLFHRWHATQPEFSFSEDLARYEVTLSKVRGEDPPATTVNMTDEVAADQVQVRRNPRVWALDIQHDVAPLLDFETKMDFAARAKRVEKRPLFLVFVPTQSHPKAYQLPEPVYRSVLELTDPRPLGAWSSDPTNQQVAEVLGDLVDRSIVELFVDTSNG